MAKDAINKVKKKKESKFIQHFWSYLFKYGPDTVVGAGNRTVNKPSPCLTSRNLWSGEWGTHTEQVPLSVMCIIKVKSGCHGNVWCGWVLTDKKLTSLMYKELMEISEKTISIEKLTKDIQWKFPHEEISSTNKHMKRYLSSWMIKRMQIKGRYNVLPIRLSKNKMSYDSSWCWC